VFYDNAVAIAVAMSGVVKVIQQHDPKLADQARRATQSIGLNVSEARKRKGRDRMHSFRVALGSADEVRAALDQGEAWGYLGADEMENVRELLDHEVAMLWKLTGGL
jgi:four helix bundle protein